MNLLESHMKHTISRMDMAPQRRNHSDECPRDHVNGSKCTSMCNSDHDWRVNIAGILVLCAVRSGFAHSTRAFTGLAAEEFRRSTRVHGEAVQLCVPHRCARVDLCYFRKVSRCSHRDWVAESRVMPPPAKIHAAAATFRLGLAIQTARATGEASAEAHSGRQHQSHLQYHSDNECPCPQCKQLLPDRPMQLNTSGQDRPLPPMPRGCHSSVGLPEAIDGQTSSICAASSLGVPEKS